MDKIVFLTHPDFSNLVSMQHFTGMLSQGMEKRHYHVEIWSPAAAFSKLPIPGRWKKWPGYLDQFLVFPRLVKKRVSAGLPNTLFVFTDHALGPWVPLLKNYPHVIHCHDFLAQKVAGGSIPGQRSSWTGRYYQKMIRQGFRQGRAFISVSKKTEENLLQFLPKEPAFSRVIYNGLNGAFQPIPDTEAWATLDDAFRELLKRGFLLHVGGNQWYKNRHGVVSGYRAYVELSSDPKPLVMVGPPLTASVQDTVGAIPSPGKVVLLSGISFEQLRALYNLASLLWFPSLAEGFGWPIVEAMACGCRVLTTAEAPMTEVGSDTIDYLERMPTTGNPQSWSAAAAVRIQSILNESPEVRHEKAKNALSRAGLFSRQKALAEYESAYRQIFFNWPELHSE